MTVDDGRVTERPTIAGGGNLAGKTAAVLGASGLYGAATARMLGHEGVNLVLGGRSRDKLEALEKEITDSGGRALVVGTHLAKRHHLDHLMEAAVEGFGGLEVLLFMARASAPPLASLDVDAFENSVDVNVKGFLYAVAAALPTMCENGGGRVVYLSAAPEAPDTLYDMGQAAARASWAASSAGLEYARTRSSYQIRAERVAEAVRGALTVPDGEEAGFSVHEV